jgi:hypothetical protein
MSRWISTVRKYGWFSMDCKARLNALGSVTMFFTACSLGM